jgi:hypothetical protein
MGSTFWLELVNQGRAFKWMPLGDVGLQRDKTSSLSACFVGKIDANEMSLSLDHKQVSAIIFKRFWSNFVGLG